MRNHLQNIVRANPLTHVCGGRVGTLIMERAKLAALVGKPSAEYGPDYINMPDGSIVEDSPKVSITWIFNSPRGFFEIRDYWWNKPGEWSIAAGSGKAGLWARSFARNLSRGV